MSKDMMEIKDVLDKLESDHHKKCPVSLLYKRKINYPPEMPGGGLLELC